MSVLRMVILAALLLPAGAPVATQAPDSTDPRLIDVTARRFAFEPAEIDVFVGERVRLMVRSGDGVHGLEIKQFKVKKEVPRGSEPIAIDFVATEAGRFPILCSEYCGNRHEEMTGLLVVQARAQ